MLERIASIVMVLFPVSEIVLAVVKRSGGGATQRDDRGSMRWVWVGTLLGVALAIAAQWVRWAHIGAPRSTVVVAALVLLVAGLVIRWIAILTLGRFFTVDVAIHPDQVVIQAGLYRFVRHPSYLGLLIAFAGLGVYFGNWLSIVGAVVPVVIGVLNRIATEERALVAALGPAYADYCERTKRLIPGVY